MEFGKHVRVRQEKFGAVVFETLREKVFVTNETGAEIFRLLKREKDPDRVADELAKNYNVDPAVIKGDVDEFISALEDNEIIKNGKEK